MSQRGGRAGPGGDSGGVVSAGGRVSSGRKAWTAVQNAPKLEPYLFVVYSPNYQTLTTGYQTSGSDRIFTDEYTDLVQHK